MICQYFVFSIATILFHLKYKFRSVLHEGEDVLLESASVEVCILRKTCEMFAKLFL